MIKKISKISLSLFVLLTMIMTGCSMETSDAELLAVNDSARATITGTSSFYAQDVSTGTYSSSFTSGNFKVYATSAKTVKISSSSKTLPSNSKSVSACLDLGGGGSVKSYRCIEFTTGGAATITVDAVGASGRKLALFNSSGSKLSEKETSSSIASYTFNASSSGTYYLMSTGSSIKVYYTKVAVGTSSGSSSSGSTSSGSSSSSSTSSTTTIELNANNLSHGTFSSKFTSGSFTVYATSSKTVSTPYCTASLNGKSFTQKLALGGGGSYGSYRAVGFSANSGATVTVYASGAAGRYLALVNSSGSVVTKKEVSSSIASYSYSISSSGTYNIMSTGSGIDIYYISVSGSSSSSSSGSSSSGSSSSGSSSSGSSSSGSTTSSTISLNDKPVGYASVSKPSSTVTVSNRSDFINYAKKGGYIIYVNGMIDISNGYLPSSGGAGTTGLNNIVKEQTSGKYTSYTTFRDAYAKACSTSTNDKSSSSPESSLGSYLWKCNTAYGNMIKVNVASNTWIIGKTSSSGVKGAMLNISSVSNVVIRNLTIQDAYDPFPHHEEDDGYNSQYDNIVIQGSSSNIWIDHCTFKDTLSLTSVKTGGSTTEKWQTYDGMCDMKGSCKNIVVSYCKFQDHDKTMLIGSSDSDGSNSTRTITLHHNYFYNCGQRLPMVRNAKLHMFNNYYDASSPRYANQYCCGVRKNALIVAENNYFGSGVKYSFKDSYGTLYVSGNSDNSSGGNKSSTSSSKPFTPSYSYSLDSASNAKSNVTKYAGAGASL